MSLTLMKKLIYIPRMCISKILKLPPILPEKIIIERVKQTREGAALAVFLEEVIQKQAQQVQQAKQVQQEV